MRKRKENTRGRDLTGQCLLQSFLLSEATHSENYYRKKMARLTSLIVQIKRYDQPELNTLLKIKLIGRILDMPLVADRNWSRENPSVQIRFNRFLDVHINYYEKALKSLEEKLSPKNIAMKDKTYTIQVGREHMEDVPVRELKNLVIFMRDFLKKEKDLPLINPEEKADAPGRQILVYRDAAFDTFTREIETDFNIYIGNDALTGISGQEILELYFMLRTFLGEDGKKRPDDYSVNPFIKEKKVAITPYVPEKRLVSLRENAPCICKRTLLTNEIGAPVSDFTLSNRYGSFYQISKKELLSLYKRIGNLLNSDS